VTIDMLFRANEASGISHDSPGGCIKLPNRSVVAVGPG